MVLKTYEPMSRIVVRLTNNPRRDNRIRVTVDGKTRKVVLQPLREGRARASRSGRASRSRTTISTGIKIGAAKGVPPLFRAGGLGRAALPRRLLRARVHPRRGEHIMCGICGFATRADGPAHPARAPGGHVPDDHPPRPGRRGHPRRGGRRPGDAAAEHHRPRRRPPAPVQRGRDDLDRLQRRGLQLPRGAGRARSAAATPSRRGPTPRPCVHAYEQWGDEFIRSVSGGCSPSPSGTRNRRRLVLVRDRIGIKPLYYTLLDDGTLVFGSELKADPRPSRASSARSSPGPWTSS